MLALVASVILPSYVLSAGAAAAPIAIDKQVVTHQATAAASISATALTTTQPGTLLVAFITSDGSTTTKQTFTSVTGGGLTWSLRQRSNTQYGTSEIWQTVAPSVLTNVVIRANRGGGAYPGSIVVTAFTGASTASNGATVAATGATGAPSATLSPTKAGSWVWATGNDWDKALARTVGTAQTKVDEYLASAGDTFWVQRQTTAGSTGLSPVTINDTAPTGDRWNLALIEIVPASVDTTAPSVPSSVQATAVSPTQVNLTWTPSTDDTGVTGYRISRDGVQVGTSTGASFTNTALVGNTTYSYTVRAVDGAANVSNPSSPVAVTTPNSDTTPPVITGIVASAITQTGATIGWSTDEAATTQVEYGSSTAYGSSSSLITTLTTSHSQALTGLAASTTYHYRVKSTDVAGNPATSGDQTFTTSPTAPDTTLPTAAITAPVTGATVTGTVSVTATASDNVGVTSVQFQLDGANLGAADTTAPYAVQWNSTTATNASHTLSAVARDAAANSGTSQAVTVTVNNVGPADPSQVGQWGPLINWPQVSIHAALTPSGKVLTFQGDFAQGGQQYVYDPSSGAIKQVPNAAADLFCAGQAVLADGRVLVLGGTATSGGLGIKDVTAFDWVTEAWQNLAPMNHGRWYATGTTLGDGRVLSISGYDRNSSDLVTIPEIYDPATNRWTDLAASATETLPVYPFMYQLPDGRVLAAGASETATDTRVLNLQTQSWSTLDSRIIDGASISNYAPGKFLKVGSASDSGESGPSLKTAFTLDMNQASPTWQPAAAMQYPRSFVNLTNLPDGTVLATGGESDKSGYVPANAVLPAEVWNPATGTWSTQSAMSSPRLYHSTAVLLPDGRVFISGSGGDPGVPDQKDSQIFSPTYLFKDARPTIASVPATVQYGSQAVVDTPDAAAIRSVSLIRTGSTTHSFDQNARALSLPFTQTSGGLSVTMPANGNTAPPGYYLLSIVNSNGVPSVSKFVRFAAPYEDQVAPTAPGSLAATGSTGAATLSWTAATDNIGVTRYDIHRSTTAGFTPSAANKVGSSTSLGYVDSGLANGTYYYRVAAADAAGNLSPASNEASATASTDTTPPTAAANLSATLNGTQVGLSWSAATDNVGVTSYQVTRNGSPIGTSATTTFTDNATQPATTYSYTVTARDAGGNVGPASNSATVTTGSASTLALDVTVSRHAPAATTIASAPITTTGSNELIVALFGLDGPSTGQTLSSVTGGGLSWRLRQRTNTQGGSSEIWQAVAPAPVSAMTVTGVFGSGSFDGLVTLAAFKGASTTVDGAVATRQASTGAPSLTLTPTKVGSLVWAVGNDYSNAIARTVGPNQTKVDEYLAPTGDTYWVQRLTGATTGTTTVTINDTAPTADRWNLTALEIPPA